MSISVPVIAPTPSTPHKSLESHHQTLMLLAIANQSGTKVGKTYPENTPSRAMLGSSLRAAIARARNV